MRLFAALPLEWFGNSCCTARYPLDNLFNIMAKTPNRQREQRGKQGRIDPWPPDFPSPEEIAEKISYAGNGKHKTYSAPNGEWIPNWRPGTAKCDKYDPECWGELQTVLKDAIRARCVQIDPGVLFPVRAWAYINGRLHEARLTNPATGEYHAFPPEKPVLPLDPDDLLKGTPRVTIPAT